MDLSPSHLPTPGDSAMDDSLDPFFLHHTDHPELVLVSQPLTGENYASWSRAMKIALLEKNKFGFVDGTISKPIGDDALLLDSWNRNNDIVVSWILNSVSKDIAASVTSADPASEIWNDLRDRFQQSNGPRIFQLRRDLMHTVQDIDPVNVYFTKLKTIWEELSNFRPACTCGQCTCGGVKELAAYTQMEYVMMFLMGLNETFVHSRGQILTLDPLPPINEVFSLIAQEESQQKIGLPSVQLPSSNRTFGFQQSSAFTVKSAASKSSKPGDNRSCSRFPRRERPFCSNCQIHGHTIDRCYKIHGFPPGHPQYKPKSTSIHQPPSSSAQHSHVNFSSDSPSSMSEFSQDRFPEFGFPSLFGGMGDGGGTRRDSIFSSPTSVDDMFTSSLRDSLPMRTSAPRKAPPIEHKLPCSLEELYKGTTKKMKISREIANASRKTELVEEILTIDIKPGLKKGTKITFPEKGNEQPNVIPSDIVFIIDEKPHSVFMRDSDDLIVMQKTSLAEVLTGCTVRLTTLDGRTLTIPINNMTNPSYEEVVPREGMPIPKDPTRKGNLRIKFNIKFPTGLSADQKSGFEKLLYS